MPRQPRQPRQPKEARSTPTRKHNRIEDAMRERLINAVFMEGMSVNATAKRYQYPVSSVRTIINNFEQTGRIAQLPRGGNRHRVPEPEHIKWMTDQLELDPELSMDTLHSRLIEHFKLDPPITKSAVQKVMAPMMSPGFRFVPVPASPPADGYNTPARITARQLLANEIIDQYGPLTECVFVAEAGYNLRMWRRRLPRSGAKTSNSAADKDDQRSQRNGTEAALEGEEDRLDENDDDDEEEGEGSMARSAGPIPTAKNTSLVVAMDVNGVIASDLRLGVATKDEILEQFLLQKLFPKLRSRRVIVMEHARFVTRDGAAIKDACRRGGGHKIVFLPPDCSPFFNAAEFCFANVQSHLRRSDIRRDSLNGHIHSSFKGITAEMTREWISTVENNLNLALRGEKLTVASHNQTPGSSSIVGNTDTIDQNNQQDMGPHVGVYEVDTNY